MATGFQHSAVDLCITPIRIGLDKVYATVCELQERFGATFWEPPKLLKELAESGRKFSDVGITDL